METLGIGLHFEDLPLGRQFRTVGRTVTEADIVNFCSCTGIAESRSGHDGFALGGSSLSSESLSQNSLGADCRGRFRGAALVLGDGCSKSMTFGPSSGPSSDDESLSKIHIWRPPGRGQGDTQGPRADPKNPRTVSETSRVRRATREK